MKTSIKFNVCALALGLAAALPLSRAQDSSLPPPPPPPAGRDEGAPPEHRADPGKRMLEHLRQALSLTDDQATQVAAVMKDQMKQGRAIREDDSLSGDEKRAKAQALRKASRDKIRAILTPEQQKTFDAMPPMEPRGRGRNHDGGGPNPGEGAPPPPPAES